jgi:DNA (cytosine-5)-methyltransferase 1
VTAVEHDAELGSWYQKQYPEDNLVQADAHQYLLHHFAEFDFIWSSPPCVTHTRMAISGRNKSPRYVDASLYQQVTLLRHWFDGKWVVENVKPYYRPWITPDGVIGRHYFWSNIDLFGIPMVAPFRKSLEDTGTVADARELAAWLGIPMPPTIYHRGNHDPAQVLRNCVHPLVGADILDRSRETQ